MSRSSDTKVPKFNMPEEGAKVDVRLPAPAGTIRLEYVSPQTEGGEGLQTTSEQRVEDHKKMTIEQYGYPQVEEIWSATWRRHKINLLALVNKALSETGAGTTGTNHQLMEMEKRLKRVLNATELKHLLRDWRTYEKDLLLSSYKLPHKSAGMVTWLHLSDLHCKGKADYESNEAAGFNRDIVVDKLWKDIKNRDDNICQDLKELDFVCLTGDLVFSGKKEEYQFFGEEVLPKLFDAIGLDETPPLFVIPGNHDIDRKKMGRTARGAQEALVRDSKTTSTPVTEVLTKADERNVYFRRLEAYRDFFKRAFDQIDPEEKGYFYVKSVPLDSGITIAILGLNSAWLSEGGESDQHNLVLGEYQVKQAIDKAKNVCADLLIALVHHPFDDWLARTEDRRKAKMWLHTDCHFVLQGHIHENEAHQQDKLHYIRAGAVYEDRYSSQPSSNSYNFVKLDLDNGEGKIYFRCYNVRRDEWVSDNGVLGTDDRGIKSFTLNR